MVLLWGKGGTISAWVVRESLAKEMWPEWKKGAILWVKQLKTGEQPLGLPAWNSLVTLEKAGSGERRHLPNGSGLMRWGHNECGWGSRDRGPRKRPPSNLSLLNIQRVCAPAGGFLGQTNLEHCWEGELDMQKREGGNPCKNRRESDPEQMQRLVFDKREYFLCIKKKRRKEETHAGAVLNGPANGKLKTFPSHYFYFLNEVRNEIISENGCKEKMWDVKWEEKI